MYIILLATFLHPFNKKKLKEGVTYVKVSQQNMSASKDDPLLHAEMATLLVFFLVN